MHRLSLGTRVEISAFRFDLTEAYAEAQRLYRSGARGVAPFGRRPFITVDAGGKQVTIPVLVSFDPMPGTMASFNDFDGKIYLSYDWLKKSWPSENVLQEVLHHEITHARDSLRDPKAVFFREEYRDVGRAVQERLKTLYSDEFLKKYESLPIEKQAVALAKQSLQDYYVKGLLEQYGIVDRKLAVGLLSALWEFILFNRATLDMSLGELKGAGSLAYYGSKTEQWASASEIIKQIEQEMVRAGLSDRARVAGKEFNRFIRNAPTYKEIAEKLTPSVERNILKLVGKALLHEEVDFEDDAERLLADYQREMEESLTAENAARLRLLQRMKPQTASRVVRRPPRGYEEAVRAFKKMQLVKKTVADVVGQRRR